MDINEVLAVVQGESTANHDDITKLRSQVERLEKQVKILMDELQGRTQPDGFPPAFDPAEQGFTKGGQS